MNSKILSLALIVTMGIGFSESANAQFWKKKKKKAVKTEKKAAAKAPKKKGKSYEDFIKDAKIIKGFMNTIIKDDKYYFEIPKTLLDKDLLLSSRISKVSTNFNASAGQMPVQPTMFHFLADKENVYMAFRQYNQKYDKDSNIDDAVERNTIDGYWKTYKIECFGKDSASYVVNMSNLFTTKEKRLSPLMRIPGLLGMFMKFDGPLNAQASKILKVKAFEKNLNIKSRLAFNISGIPYTVEMTRNIIVLPEKPMMPRLSDERLGYFESKYMYYDKTGAEVKKLVHRWNIKPKDEDLNKYLAGELVEPEKPIIWYVDSAIPDEYRTYIKLGIQDWQEAFEEIGFKNAIIARDYPTKEENPNFDPDDIRYSCYRYVPTPTKNSMGPSWVDPRSGEIICGDVLFYSNVVKLLQEWRFVQTAQLDPRVRKKEIDDKTLGESLRNVAAHEVGHTLGLMHNFIASATYPVEKLRDAKFTKEYGTTPSIMDYARYNYVAQPGDKGVYMLPPKVGIYDKFQIKLAYKYVPNAKTPEEDFKEVEKWLYEKKDDLRYTYVNPYTQKGYINPANNTESVGDDPVKASKYGIKNLKYIESHLTDWLLEDGDDFKALKGGHYAVANQFLRYMGHVLPMIGGEYRTPIRYGYNIPFQTYVSKAKQKEALKFVLDNARDFGDWWNNSKVTKYLGDDVKYMEVQSKLFSALFNKNIADALIEHELSGVNNSYKFNEYQNDIYKDVWNKTIKGKSLTYTDKMFQTYYVNTLIKIISPKPAPARKGLFGLTDDADSGNDYFTDDEKEISLLSKDLTSPTDFPVVGAMAHKTLMLLKKAKGRTSDKLHYEVLYFKLKKAMEIE